MALGRVHGEFAPRALRLVLEWAELHKAELLEDWQLARLYLAGGCIPAGGVASLAPCQRGASLSSLQRRTSTTGC